MKLLPQLPSSQHHRRTAISHFKRTLTTNFFINSGNQAGLSMFWQPASLRSSIKKAPTSRQSRLHINCSPTIDFTRLLIDQQMGGYIHFGNHLQLPYLSVQKERVPTPFHHQSSAIKLVRLRFTKGTNSQNMMIF